MPFGEVIAVVSQRLGEGRGLPLSGWTPGEHSHGGWLATCISFVAVFVLGAGIAYASRRFLSKRTAELDVLMNQSAAFYRRWPEPELGGAPRSEIMAEADRSQRIIELLQQRAAACAADNEFLHGPIAGVQAWIELLHRTVAVPASV